MRDPTIMGVRLGLYSALAVVDRWDRYTRERILDLIRQVEEAQRIEAEGA